MSITKIGLNSLGVSILDRSEYEVDINIFISKIGLNGLPSPTLSYVPSASDDLYTLKSPLYYENKYRNELSLTLEEGLFGVDDSLYTQNDELGVLWKK